MSSLLSFTSPPSPHVIAYISAEDVVNKVSEATVQDRVTQKQTIEGGDKDEEGSRRMPLFCVCVV